MTHQRKIAIGAILGTLLLISALAFLVTRRSTELTVQAPAPPRSVTPVPLPPPTPSVIAVQAKLPLADLQKVAESELTDYLRDPIKWESGAVKADVQLTPGSLTITSTPDATLSVNVPFHFNARVTFAKKILGRTLQQHEDIAGNATATLTLAPALTPTWRMTAETDSHISIQKADLKILGVTLSVRSILTELVEEKLLPTLENRLVSYITRIDLKPRITGLWSRLYEPIVVSQSPPIALTIDPLEILAQHLTSDTETLFLNFGIKAYIRADMRDMAAETPAITPTELPDIRYVDSLEAGYHVLAPIEMTYAAVESFAKPHVEKQHHLKGVETHVETLTLYGSGTQLVAGIQFRMPAFGAKGQLYLLGTPIYDPAEIALAVTEFDYALTTQSLLLDIAQISGEGIFPHLRTTVENRLIFPLADQLTALRERLAAAIAERTIGSYITLRGTVDTVAPEALYLTESGVRIPFRLQGNLNCEITLNQPAAEE